MVVGRGQEEGGALANATMEFREWVSPNLSPSHRVSHIRSPRKHPSIKLWHPKKNSDFQLSSAFCPRNTNNSLGQRLLDSGTTLEILLGRCMYPLRVNPAVLHLCCTAGTGIGIFFNLHDRPHQEPNSKGGIKFRIR